MHKTCVQTNIQHEVKSEVLYRSSTVRQGQCFPNGNFILSHFVRKTEVSYGQNVLKVLCSVKTRLFPDKLLQMKELSGIRHGFPDRYVVFGSDST